MINNAALRRFDFFSHLFKRGIAMDRLSIQVKGGIQGAGQSIGDAYVEGKLRSALGDLRMKQFKNQAEIIEFSNKLRDRGFSLNEPQGVNLLFDELYSKQSKSVTGETFRNKRAKSQVTTPTKKVDKTHAKSPEKRSKSSHRRMQNKRVVSPRKVEPSKKTRPGKHTELRQRSADKTSEKTSPPLRGRATTAFTKAAPQPSISSPPILSPPMSPQRGFQLPSIQSGDAHLAFKARTDFVGQCDESARTVPQNKIAQQALIIAIGKSSLDEAEYAINAGADVNAADAKGFTPLARAVGVGAPKTTQFLLSRGADPCGCSGNFSLLTIALGNKKAASAAEHAALLLAAIPAAWVARCNEMNDERRHNAEHSTAQSALLTLDKLLALSLGPEDAAHTAAAKNCLSLCLKTSIKQLNTIDAFLLASRSAIKMVDLPEAAQLCERARKELPDAFGKLFTRTSLASSQHAQSFLEVLREMLKNQNGSGQVSEAVIEMTRKAAEKCNLVDAVTFLNLSQNHSKSPGWAPLVDVAKEIIQSAERRWGEALEYLSTVSDTEGADRRWEINAGVHFGGFIEAIAACPSQCFNNSPKEKLIPELLSDSYRVLFPDEILAMMQILTEALPAETEAICSESYRLFVDHMSRVVEQSRKADSEKAIDQFVIGVARFISVEQGGVNANAEVRDITRVMFNKFDKFTQNRIRTRLADPQKIWLEKTLAAASKKGKAAYS